MRVRPDVHPSAVSVERAPATGNQRACGPQSRPVLRQPMPEAESRQEFLASSTGGLSRTAAIASQIAARRDLGLVDEVLDLLHRMGLPAKTLRPALEATLRGSVPTQAALASALQRVLSEPNFCHGTTLVPVHAAKRDADLVEDYLKAGLLQRLDGQLFAVFRDPAVTGTDPEHNRALGRDSVMTKGVGVCEPYAFPLGAGAAKHDAAKVVAYYDPTKKVFHRCFGALTEAQAQDNETPAFRQIRQGLNELLLHAEPPLAALIAKHHLDANVVPNRFLTLALEALPVVPTSDKAVELLQKRLGNAIVQVPGEVPRTDARTLWVTSDAYWKLFDLAPAAAPEHDPVKPVVQCYTANHAVLRYTRMTMATRTESDCVPRLHFNKPTNPARAVVTMAMWDPVLADYGWRLVCDEKTHLLRIADRKTGKPLAVAGDTQAGSREAALTVAEGNAVLSGMILRSAWKVGVSTGALAGGNPFQGRNSNARCRLDWDTAAPQGLPRENIGFSNQGKRLSVVEEHLEDLMPRKQSGGAVRQVAHTAIALGLTAHDVAPLVRKLLEIALERPVRAEDDKDPFGYLIDLDRSPGRGWGTGSDPHNWW